ncbi:MAG: hypothetical protein GQ531_02050 [Sulfurovum sp.]|nr:hypothetical protein [Sulfurovum sp.]
MLIKKYFPSLGFIILTITILLSVLFIQWALGPLNYEQAKLKENKGQELIQKGQTKEASQHFLHAAQLTNNKIDKSRRYYFVASTNAIEKDKIKYLKMAYELNRYNTKAEEKLKILLGKNIYTKYVDTINSKIKYKDDSYDYWVKEKVLYRTYKNEISFKYGNRYSDGWSKGSTATIAIDVKNSFEYKYEIEYYTSNTLSPNHVVQLYVDNHLMNKTVIRTHQKHTYRFSIPKGIHTVSITIDDTFVPKELRINEDSRTLGVNFKVKVVKVKIDE